MKNTIKLFGIIALAALIGFAITACQEPDDPDPEPGTKTPTDITWTLGQVGGVAGADGAAPTATTTAITITFSAAVELTEADIHISDAASHDSTQEITSSGNVWTVPVTVSHTDNARVTVNKDGVEGGEKTVLVYKQGEAQAITWTAVADGTEGTADSTKITFTFSEDVEDLDADDITLTDDNGSATKGTLTGSETSWELGITVTTPGFVTVAITKTGISATSQNVEVHKEGVVAQDITWTAVADGEANTTTSTTITFTFSEAVHDLAVTDITIHDGSGVVTKGEMTGSETTWELGITVETAGTVSVTITKAGINADAQNVPVHKEGSVEPDITWTATADGVQNTTASTKITIIFSSAVADLTSANFTLTDGTGSATITGLTGNPANTTWELGITVQSAGTVSVTVDKTGVVATAQNVTVHKAPITWNAVADGASGTTTSTKITFTFSEAVSGLEASDITVNSGTGTASKSGTLTGSGTSWDLGITVETEGTVSIAVNKTGINTTAQLVNVYKVAINPITDQLTTYINTMDQLVFSYTTGNSGTYIMNSPEQEYGQPSLNNGKYIWEKSAEGSWTWDQHTQTVALTVEKVADETGTLLDKTSSETMVASMVREELEYVYESTYEYSLEMYLDENGDWGFDYTQEEAEALAAADALEAAIMWYDSDYYETLEEVIQSVIDTALEVFDPKSYTYTFSTDGESLILLEPLPVSVGSNELSGKTYFYAPYGSPDDEDHTYVFTANTYTENIPEVSWMGTPAATKSGAYSYNSTIKRVYLKPMTVNGVTPLQYYINIEYSESSNPYPSEADYRTATTHSWFRTTNNSYGIYIDPYDEEAPAVNTIKPRG
jgi:methionine-rich copper-binding protein CopC